MFKRNGVSLFKTFFVYLIKLVKNEEGISIYNRWEINWRI